MVVHGAGPQISAQMRERGLEIHFVDGRRYTTPEALEVVRESLAEVNAELFAAIGPRAVGFLGDELGLEAAPGLQARPRRRPAAESPRARSERASAGSNPGHRSPGEGAAQRQCR